MAPSEVTAAEDLMVVEAHYKLMFIKFALAVADSKGFKSYSENSVCELIAPPHRQYKRPTQTVNTSISHHINTNAKQIEGAQ
jgi:hypothetical protein